MDAAFSVGFSALQDIVAFFARPPMIYFVAVTLVGAVAGVAKIFVPMRKR